MPPIGRTVRPNAQSLGTIMTNCKAIKTSRKFRISNLRFQVSNFKPQIIFSVLTAACLAICAPAFSQPASAPTTAATSPTRTPEQIQKEFNDSGRELQQILGSHGTQVFTDEKLRKEVAPKAIPALRKNLALFEELAAYDPAMKMQEVTVRTQFLALMATMGDQDAEKDLKRSAEGKGEDALAAQQGLLMSQWWQSNGDVEKQKKLLDQAVTMLKANPKDDGAVAMLMEMANTGAANEQIKNSAEDAIIASAQGNQGKTIAKEIQAQRTLKQMEGKPLVLSGSTVDGKTFSTDQWKGKVIFVDFWATWCGPCRAELPRVIKAYSDFHAKGLEVLGVSCDQNPDDLKTFLKDHPDMPWPQLFDEKKPGWHELARKFGIDGIPTMFLIDKKGILRTVEAREDFETEIPKLLAE
jgi:thiol-disulfide isomerase/thioredoxin